MIEAITEGAAAIVSGVGSTISSLISNANVLILVGLAVGYGIVKYTINLIPMIRSKRR